MIFGAFSAHLNELKFGMSDAEQRFIKGEYTAESLIKIMEHRVRVGSAPMINQNKLFSRYVQDFCGRLRIDLMAFMQVFDAMHGTGKAGPDGPGMNSFETRKLLNKKYEDLRM